MVLRCQFLIDGYNLYHSMDDAGKHSLKWLNLQRLAEIITAPLPAHTVETYWFSAYAEWKRDPYERHRTYVSALKSAGVHIILGNFKLKARNCKNCSSEWTAHEEKETDVNIAIRLIKAAYEKSYDRMYIVTGDTDIAPALRMAKEIYREGLITIAAPPGRDKNISALLRGSDNQQRLSFEMFKQAQFPDVIYDSTGKVLCRRPDKYKLGLATTSIDAGATAVAKSKKTKPRL